uniref:Transposase IS200-like domain-containing protein n=1 Tax=Candidatus Kentrum sp. DK TaxID=2126562 RepID=A0A450SKS2_9GAMM|nr:MAG: hypothetical protein BECKDK2373B_GA0170837_104525 [Candidatus Kentron sp. DK]
MDKFQNKYRIPSTRLPHWDYGWNAVYFVTICTGGQQHHFGGIVDDAMWLSDVGEIANACWMDIPLHFPFVHLDGFVIMPNHVHGIIMIESPRRDAIYRVSDKPRLYGAERVSTENSIPTSGGFAGNKNPMRQENLSKIIRWYKGRVTFESRKITPDFCWQPRFYEHIVRSEKTLEAIRNYILANPWNWKRDSLFSP